MKVASVVLNAVGLAINLIAGIYLISTGIGEFAVSGVFALAGVLVNILTIVSLSKNSKSVALGVVDIICGSTLGGIFYLIWKPTSLGRAANNRVVSEYPSASYTSSKVKDENNIVDDSINVEMVKKYKALLDEGLITQEEYDAKRKDLLNL